MGGVLLMVCANFFWAEAGSSGNIVMPVVGVVSTMAPPGVGPGRCGLGLV